MADSYDHIQPTMRRLVKWLNELGFNTTDSGDGIINVEAGMECALEVPHVHIVTERNSMLDEADRLASETSNIPAATVQATYQPGDGLGIVTLWGVTSADLPGEE